MCTYYPAVYEIHTKQNYTQNAQFESDKQQQKIF